MTILLNRDSQSKESRMACNKAHREIAHTVRFADPFYLQQLATFVSRYRVHFELYDNFHSSSIHCVIVMSCYRTDPLSLLLCMQTIFTIQQGLLRVSAASQVSPSCPVMHYHSPGNISVYPASCSRLKSPPRGLQAQPAVHLRARRRGVQWSRVLGYSYSI